MTRHYRAGDRTACLIPGNLVRSTIKWGEVTCKMCKQTSEYTYFMEQADKIK